MREHNIGSGHEFRKFMEGLWGDTEKRQRCKLFRETLRSRQQWTVFDVSVSYPFAAAWLQEQVTPLSSTEKTEAQCVADKIRMIRRETQVSDMHPLQHCATTPLLPCET